MAQKGHHVTNYADDFIIIGKLHQCQAAYQYLCKLLQELGFSIAQKKLQAPTTEAVCLGIAIDNKNSKLSIPIEKLKNIKEICLSWASAHYCSKRQLKSLLGSLLYVSKCVKYSRFFLNRMLQVLPDHTATNSIKLDKNFHRDLKWFNTFLTDYNGVSFFKRHTFHKKVYLDASLTGMGAVCDNEIYATPLHLKLHILILPFWKC